MQLRSIIFQISYLIIHIHTHIHYIGGYRRRKSYDLSTKVIEDSLQDLNTSYTNYYRWLHLMAIDNTSKRRAIRKAIEILNESSSRDKTMNVNEMDYVVDTLKDIEKQLEVEQDEPTGIA
jgi:hypothetical protein